MPSTRAIVSTPLRHPVVGPAVAIRANVRQVWALLFLDLALIAIAMIGLALGLGDLRGTGTSIGGVGIPAWLMGMAQIAAAFVVAAWAIRATYTAAKRIRNPYLLVVGRDGFEYDLGHGAISWSEVDTVSDPSSRSGVPESLKVQLNDPGDYVDRHGLSPLDRVVFRYGHRSLNLGSSNLMPVDLVEALMRKRLAEFRGPDQGVEIVPASAKSAAARPSGRPGRRR